MLYILCTVILLVALVGLSVFQILLAMGKPYGRYAWGGAHVVLPRRLRIASALSVVLYAIFALIVLDAAGYVTIFASKIPILVLASYSTLGIVMNALSRSNKERAVMTPLVTVLALYSWLLYLQ